MVMFQVGAGALQKISQHRRDQLRPHVDPAYRKLCNRPEKEDQELLGPDIEEKIASLGKNKSINKREIFLGHRPQRGRRIGQHTTSRNYGSRYSANSNKSRYNNRAGADTSNSYNAGGKLKHQAGANHSKTPYAKNGSRWNANWRKN